MKGLLRAVAGVALGLVARLWLATLRVTVEVHPALGTRRHEPWVLAFFHGEQLLILAWPRRRPTVVLVSHSADGQMQTRALGVQGLRVVRGSSSRGAVRGLAALLRRVRSLGGDAAFAVDGPRGPLRRAKGGAAMVARALGGALVPMGAAAAHAHVLRRAWDQFVLPLPFTRVAVVLGAPVVLSDHDPSGLLLLDQAILGCGLRAQTLLGASPPSLDPAAA